MDKRTILKEVSASELRQELIARLQEQIRRNEQENEAIRQQIRNLAPEIKVVNGSLLTGGRSRTLVRNDQSLREAIVHVLREANEPLRSRDIVERVKSSGYQSRASNFGAMVNISLTRNTELFEKVERGVYKLRDDAPVAVGGEGGNDEEE
jgi:hypothetical protein